MKIIKVNKEIKPWIPDHKKYTLYSAWCTLDHNGKEVKCKLACFKDGVIKEGAEISENEYDIKIEDKEYQGESYKQYTLKKKKSEWGGNKGSQKTVYTLEEFEAVFNRARIVSNEDETQGLTKDVVFERYINNALMYGVKIPVDKKNPAEIVREAVKGTKIEEGVPFDPAGDEIDENDPFFQDEAKNG